MRSHKGHFSLPYCSTTTTQMLEITVQQREVGHLLHSFEHLNDGLSAFLSWLRLATYMAVVAIAILISFHLKHQPTELERKVALPFGIIFWLLALACLVSGLHNYIKTVNRYSRRQALVQTGVGTQVVSLENSVIDVRLSGTSRFLQWWHVPSSLHVFYCCQRVRKVLSDCAMSSPCDMITRPSSLTSDADHLALSAVSHVALLNTVSLDAKHPT